MNMKKTIVAAVSILLSLSLLHSQTPEASKLFQEVKSNPNLMANLVKSGFETVDSTSVYDLGVLFYLGEEYDSAGVCFEAALGKVKKYGSSYEKILDALSSVYMKTGDNAKIDWLMQVIDDHNQHELEKGSNDYKSKLDAATIYLNKGNEAAAKQLMAESIALCRTEEERIEVDAACANLMFQIRDFQSAALYYYSAAQRLKNIGSDKAKVANNLYEASLNFFLASQFEISELRVREAIDILTDISDDRNEQLLLKCYSLLGDVLFVQVKNLDALAVYQRVLDACSAKIPNTEKHADALEDVAKVEVRIKKYDEASVHYKDALEIYKALNIATKYSNTYSSYLICLRKSGKQEEADAIELEARRQRQAVWKGILDSELPALDITKKYLGSEVYSNSLHTIAGCYFGLEQYEKAAEYYRLYVDNLRKTLMESFVVMDVTDRKRLWAVHNNNLDEFRFNITSLPNEGLLALYSPILYDMELLSKGILLNSSIEFAKVLSLAGRKELMELYEDLKELHQQIQGLQKDVTESNIDELLTLRQRYTGMNHKLMSECKEVKDYTRYLSYSWEDVQEKLSDDEIAIEFSTLKVGFTDKDTYLVAVVLGPTGIPQMAVVSNKRNVKALMSKEDLYDNPDYYKYIWGRLAQHLEGKRKVFFAPDNMLASFAVEYLIYKDSPFFETREVYRLSSTKELCKDYVSRKPDKMAVFGDIDYNAENQSDTRGGLSFGKLVFSSEEIDGICKQFRKSCRVSRYSGRKASEDSFRSLSEDCPDYIHISSHGKYDGDEKTDVEEAMNVSYLALSGANVVNADQTDDGIVTASDVAKMNLRNCDLVVLSACETGLGSLGNDGVFGLQRGFKNAGVHSIMMSLKKVYDQATSKLMIAFYKGIAEGLSKREALIAAQKELRNTAEYAKGQFWAPFILLDAYESNQ